MLSHLNNHHPKKHAISFKHAFAGIMEGLRDEPRFQLQLIASFLAVFAGIFFRITTSEWLALILVISFVLTTELINTSIENTIDLVSPDFHPLSKAAKDCAAGAVLVAAVSSLAVGLIIFIHHLT
ncbi:MAG: diacylglycerol kinase family protein [Patescibacteria group bacterium]|nr:diacylglycerol kinase family protein [Patescibacteria group bacterium]